MVCTHSHQVSRVRCYSGSPTLAPQFRLRDFHPLWPDFPIRSAIASQFTSGPYPQRINPPGLGCSPFARHYSGNRFRFLLLGLLRCFTSAGLAPMRYLFTHRSHDFSCGVSPFGYLRFKACLRLPEAFRSLPRPSSPCVAKASSRCPSSFIHLTLSFFNIGLLVRLLLVFSYSKFRSSFTRF